MATTPRLFVQDDLTDAGTVTLPADQSHYLVTVLRKEAGAPLLVFNGRDGEWAAEIATAHKKHCVISLVERTREQAASPDLALLFAPVKKAPIDQIAQKATELGCSILQPVMTARTIVNRVKEDRLAANTIEAAEQSERLDVPEVRATEKLEAVIGSWQETYPGRRLIFCDEAGDEDGERWGGAGGRARPMLEALAAFRDTPLPSRQVSWAILTGPEGGFTPEERDLLRRQDFVTPVTLGPRILRADTAAFAAITLWQAALGDLSEGFTVR
ncbi:16S rRNA (uracil(1498)-N(3))-methyltransferase [Aquisalinus flavus]|uniref:Ribosomal RNA small subunit methyltransferase E n=1 Tax=Aquisalinus flavus TaxID=1526572 RepID=A0A8J2V137_9PROT|nr:16S rRNA (uracil(1498)-N(3))-methyltransferase [Aquisalinus flavus]MBD0427245.1 16S rRNA (uracil(1498)-N(3))-methyltransferase [Aquisalinus flavus]UNE47059.1 16S rRNA (uracil(1498)-N(3))-methyltransferase [Aquisalinus flavus]GGC99471.1 ribosomal RNA small subunit methyltransferase E [Aquisalinus flavus]